MTFFHQQDLGASSGPVLLTRPAGSKAFSPPLRVGIAGCGVFGGWHAQKIIHLDNAALSGLYDVSLSRAEALGRRWGIEACDAYDRFLEKIDMVIIATPASTHYDLARRALIAGKHCLVEKPLATCVAEADELVRIAKQRKVILQVGHQERYVLEALGILPMAGDARRISCERVGPYTNRGADVSVVFDLMVHDLDLSRRLTESPVKSMQAVYYYRANNTDLERGDACRAKLVLEDGAQLAFFASRMAKRKARIFRLEHEKGSVAIDFLKREMHQEGDALRFRHFADISDQQAVKDPVAWGSMHFAETVIRGGAPIVTGIHGRDAVYWAELIHHAAVESALRSSAAPVAVHEL